MCHRKKPASDGKNKNNFSSALYRFVLNAINKWMAILFRIKKLKRNLQCCKFNLCHLDSIALVLLIKGKFIVVTNKNWDFLGILFRMKTILKIPE